MVAEVRDAQWCNFSTRGMSNLVAPTQTNIPPRRVTTKTRLAPCSLPIPIHDILVRSFLYYELGVFIHPNKTPIKAVYFWSLSSQDFQPIVQENNSHHHYRKKSGYGHLL
ncbi:hypothetical protein K443DRAFT_150858 [Laccaria amethystina LaAM-08-1]|uniref:Uncharacterized protein n=1 Tax=Laccaria amethystina LaAM-08-1 TaxID=1095629 RepID=A0A0C9YBW3_9AGAR|nr:hypothetical protein K443DRAFT_150858 [Laccaria amethystina LaAM-08-1]